MAPKKGDSSSTTAPKESVSSPIVRSLLPRKEDSGFQQAIINTMPMVYTSNNTNTVAAFTADSLGLR